MEIKKDYATCGLTEALAPDEVIYLSVRFFESYKNYYYQTKNDDINIGDCVVVPVGNDGTERIVEVVKKERYKIENVPIPLEKVKTVIEKFSPPPRNGPAIDCPALNAKIWVDECYEYSCMGLAVGSDEEHERFMRVCKKCRYNGD